MEIMIANLFIVTLIWMVLSEKKEYKMRCPKCNKEIDYVDIESDYGSLSKGYLKGNTIVEYEIVKTEIGEELSESTFIYCPECGEEISNSIKK